MPSCAVYTCKKKSKTSNMKKDGITFHMFPRQSELAKIWTACCHHKYSTWQPTRSSTICSRHFEPSQFMPNKRRKLKKGAVPTLFLTSSENSHLGEFVKPGLPEAKELVARVYHYLQNEYEQLKNFTGNSCDIAPLENVLQRTAAATGVSEEDVTAILNEEADEEYDDVPRKRLKLVFESEDDDMSVHEDESSGDEITSDCQLAPDNRESNEECHSSDAETWRVEVEDDDECSYTLFLSPGAAVKSMDIKRAPPDIGAIPRNSLRTSDTTLTRSEPQDVKRKKDIFSDVHSDIAQVSVKCEPPDTELIV